MSTKVTPWWRNARGEWYVVAQVLLMVAVLAGPSLDRASWSGPWATAALAGGIALGALGAALAVAGLLALGRNLTPLPHPREGATLVASGPYAVVRHPIYAGISFAAFGWALAWRSPATLALAAALFVFFDVKSRREERWLCEAFAGYGEYRRRVKKLVPFLY